MNLFDAFLVIVHAVEIAQLAQSQGLGFRGPKKAYFSHVFYKDSLTIGCRV